MSDTTTAIAISPATHRVLLELAEQTHCSVETVLQKAIETHRRQVFLDGTNEAFAALREDETAWQAYAAELRAWDATLHDGL